MPRFNSFATRHARKGPLLREKREFARVCHFTMREWALCLLVMSTGTDTIDKIRAPAARRILIDLAAIAGIGAVLAVLAPLGTHRLPMAERLLYWCGLGIVGYAIYRPIGGFATAYAKRLALPRWYLWALAVALASIPMAAIVWIANHMGSVPEWPGAATALTHYAYVALIGAIVTAVMNFVSERTEPSGASDTMIETPTHAAPPVRFIDRLPAHVGTQLVALEMEDHYVRAHTTLGSELVLMRMRDAVAELDGLDGEQVHRSWWVARDAVEDTIRDGRNVRLVLPSGLEAPVSRANIARLKELGWL